MTKEQASREWLELNKMQKTIRIKKVGENDTWIEARYDIIIQELEALKAIYQEIIDPYSI